MSLFAFLIVAKMRPVITKVTGTHRDTQTQMALCGPVTLVVSSLPFQQDDLG